VILPFTVLRRLNCVLDPTKEAVLKEKEKRETAGLNPNAPMKPSGIEWLGDVPEQWEVGPLKYLSDIKTGFAFKSDEFTDNGVPVLRIGDICMSGTVDFTEAKYLPTTFIDEHEDALVQQHDIVIAMTGATIGKAAKYTQDTPALLNQGVCIFRA
jgi:type I restriction enzyme, S subunit